MMVTMRSSSSDVISPALSNQKLASCKKPEKVMCQRVERNHVPFIEIYIGFLADQIRISASNSFNFCQSVHDLLLAVDIGVEKTEDELEVRLLP